MPFLKKLLCIVLLLFISSMMPTMSIAKSSGTVFHDLNGRAISLKNKWVILNYWAAWCSACLEEMPELNRFYQNNRHQDVVLIGVSYDRLPVARVRDAVRQANVNFPTIIEDPSRVWNLEVVDAVPMTFIINPEGQVVHAVAGPNTEESLSSIINALRRPSTR